MDALRTGKICYFSLKLSQNISQSPTAQVSSLIFREKRIFKVMAEFIGSRDGIQCRSHHMKQLKAHKGKLRNIISKYKKNCDPQIFRPKVVESRENQQIL